MINKKSKLYLIGVCAVLLIVVFANNVTGRIMSTSEHMYESAVVQIDTDGISRAYFAKMISLLQYNKTQLLAMSPTFSYEDVEEEHWTQKYISGLQEMEVMGVFHLKEAKFYPNKNVTYGECKELVELVGTSVEESSRQEELSFLYESSKEQEEITWEEFLTTYHFLVEKVYGIEGTSLDDALQMQELYIVGTPSNISSLDAEEQVFTTVADLGVYTNDGLVVEPYIDSTVNVWVRDNEILYIDSTLEKEKDLSNIYVLGQEDMNLSVYINGVTRTFTMNNALDQDITSTVADITISNKKIKSIHLKSDTITDKVLVTEADYIELENYGKIPVNENYQIYKVKEDQTLEMATDILVGYENAEFVISEGEICAVLLTGQVTPQNIRVVLNDTSYKSLYHSEVKLTADQDFIVYYGEEKKEYTAGKQVTITKSSDLLKEGRLRVETSGEDGKIQVLSIQRKGINPSYRGAIEVESTSSGLTIVNELSMEEYLYAVIPSEMPVSYGLEALKVQAICARSYAYNHLLNNSCSQYGAHVDDSTTYQVYNATPESEDSINAVKETFGKVIQYDGEVVYAYYFSTSCGYTADVSNVWLSDNEMPYLQAVFQGEDSSIRDYSLEESFREFITTNKEDTYESAFPWYRWTVTIDYSDLKKMVDNRLSSLYKKRPAYVLTLDSEGTYQQKSIDTVGTIKNIKITKRESSGLATEMVIEGSKNTVKIKSESFIRQLLRPSYDAVERQDGSKVESLSLLPSAFFVIDKVKSDGSVTGIKLSGGGYGHGVGMSQNGVKALADAGKSYEEILKHYYSNIEIGSIY